MRPVDKSLFLANKHEYNPYGDAKPDLIFALGNFCSYCEREGFSSSLDVEHIKDKDANPLEKFLWNNFLIACKNCNSIKGTKNVDFLNIILPHINDTFSVFEYLESGLISIKPGLDAQVELKVKELVALVGLDRRPGHKDYSFKDDRWQERRQAWELAKKYKNKVIDGKCDNETVLDLALKTGFWSIWINVFDGHIDIQKELINGFKGTNALFFKHIL